MIRAIIPYFAMVFIDVVVDDVVVVFVVVLRTILLLCAALPFAVPPPFEGAPFIVLAHITKDGL